MTSPRQLAIFRHAPRFVGAYMPEDEQSAHPLVIPDTSVARARAAADGASRFDTLSFNRPDEPWAPHRRLFGDFYGLLHPARGYSGEEIRTALVDQLAGTLSGRFQWCDWTAMRFVHLRYNSLVIGVKIPAAAFGMEAGSPYLHTIYRRFAEALTNVATGGTRQPFQIEFSDQTVVPNLYRGLDGFAVSMTYDDIHGKSASDVRRHASEPRDIDTLASASLLGGDHFWTVLQEAKNAWEESLATRLKPEWLDIVPIFGPHDYASRIPTIDGTKCAMKLKAWMQAQDVREFRQRDALAAVDGTFTRDHGVAEALNILEQHNVVRTCSRPATRYPGRPPGDWYIVNPKLFRNSPTKTIPT